MKYEGCRPRDFGQEIAALEEAIELLGQCGLCPTIGSQATIRDVAEDLNKIIGRSDFPTHVAQILFQEALQPDLLELMREVAQTAVDPKDAHVRALQRIIELKIHIKTLSDLIDRRRLLTYKDGSVCASLIADADRRIKIVEALKIALNDPEPELQVTNGDEHSNVDATSGQSHTITTSQLPPWYASVADSHLTQDWKSSKLKWAEVQPPSSAEKKPLPPTTKPLRSALKKVSAFAQASSSASALEIVATVADTHRTHTDETHA